MRFCIVILVFAVSLFTSFCTELSESVERPLPKFAFSWLDDKNTFDAGDIATIKIKVLDYIVNGENLLDGYPVNLTISVNGKSGNSSYISGVFSSLGGDCTDWSISFIPITVGLFNVMINDDYFAISDSSLHFLVLPGRMYPSVCVASWTDIVNEFVAGTKAAVMILPKDAFGNNISSISAEPYSYKFMLTALYENGSLASSLNITHVDWNEFGYLVVEFVVTIAGSFKLHIEGENQSLIGSPLPLKVKSGSLDTTNCLAKWNYGTNVLQIFSKLEIFIHQKDQYGNLVPGLYEFDAEVVEKGTNLSIPIADLQFKEVIPGIQLFSFSVLEPGEFVLTIFDMEQNQSISNMPYDYTVFVGYCDELNSVINGSGLAGSIAGKSSNFSVYLNDMYHYPSPVDTATLWVKIMSKVDSSDVLANIYPVQIADGDRPMFTGEYSYGAENVIASNPALFLEPNNNNSTVSVKFQTSIFDVIYTPERSGTYEIQVFCGNIPLNGGHSFLMEVKAGEVDITLSRVVKFSPNVQNLIKNEVVVQLMDSFSNPVLSQQSKLSLVIASINNSESLSWMFSDNKDGSYVSYYLAKDVGTYEICVSFEGKYLYPCPFGAYVYSSEYFPRVYNDTLSVWEDESIAFDVLENDYFAGDNASIVESSMPRHGSLLKYGRLFRYTPHKGYFGNDSFTYTISDINGNIVSAMVIISVLGIPPQFVSSPIQLKATEDMISPRFGGFPGFEIAYSDLMENISVTLSSQSGTIFLSPMLMQFQDLAWSGLSVNKGGKEGKGLTLVGVVEVINHALQSIQYLGNENFFGEDAIHVSSMNKNGANDAQVVVSVEPINDPPFIHAPEFIMLEEDNNDGLLKRDQFDFLIGDPDLQHFPGNESYFLVTLSLEVNVGILVTSLPVHLINTTELKIKDSHQWQPLQNFVTISKHFLIKGKGIRFRGTIMDCNNVIQQLQYQGGEPGAVLTVTVNDMGNYGCCPDCAEGMSLPLFSEATVNLIRRRPMSSMVAHTMGEIIVVGFVVMFSLGVVLLIFICKCAIALVKERKRCNARKTELLKMEHFQNHTSNATSLDDATYFTACCSSPFLLRSQNSNFRQRSCRQSGTQGSCSNEYCSSQSSGD
ncbi:PREDICTED: protein GAMETE EXPRESSED 2 isoform X2 [Nelumbo nucifera]|uniref:Protein GAMETE EXPRESSED 2 isoform X2 n=1 Tax=Nelumbo nucifera TaxID=4432 RepID=A0A1U8ABK7_NELNU|nr:PREDICTED: protein GAMETE EXPRESSED 2 isoform X2 [Nelumbo nucifera]